MSRSGYVVCGLWEFNTFLFSKFSWVSCIYVFFVPWPWVVSCSTTQCEVLLWSIHEPSYFVLSNFHVLLLFGKFMLTWHVKLDNFTFLASEYELLLLGFWSSPLHDFNNWLLFFFTSGLGLVASFFSFCFLINFIHIIDEFS